MGDTPSKQYDDNTVYYPKSKYEKTEYGWEKNDRIEKDQSGYDTKKGKFVDSNGETIR